MKIPWLGLLLAATLAAAPHQSFTEHVIATDLTGGYQVIAVDMDQDGDLDLVALASGLTELLWFENPGWQRHVLASGVHRSINLAACSTDAEGYPVFVMAQDFQNQGPKSIGTVLRLERRRDVHQPYEKTEIDRLPTSHRIRCADIDGSGKRVFVNAPLVAATAVPPDYRGRVPLVFYRPGDWKRQLIDDPNEGVRHGIFVCDWDGDGADEILTASFTGIHLYDRVSGKWVRTEIARGDPSPWPKSGASDLAVGQAGGERFIASIEPWHGNQVVVYTRQRRAWKRQVIDDSLVDGHTVAAADLNGDGEDEIIAGHRRGRRSVYIYYRSGAAKWSKTVLDDGGIAAAACAVADLNGDGHPDITCIGSATTNLKWYENLGSE